MRANLRGGGGVHGSSRPLSQLWKRGCHGDSSVFSTIPLTAVVVVLVSSRILKKEKKEKATHLASAFSLWNADWMMWIIQTSVFFSFFLSHLLQLFIYLRFTFSVLRFSAVSLQSVFFLLFPVIIGTKWRLDFSCSSSLSLFFSWMPPVLRFQVNVNFLGLNDSLLDLWLRALF